MYNRQHDSPAPKRGLPHIKPGQFALFFVTVVPFGMFAAICANDGIHGPADRMPTFAWLGGGLAMAVSILIPVMFAIHDRVDNVCDAVDDLKSRVRIEGIRAALDSTITLLDDPTPDRVKAARDVLRNFKAELPSPPETQSGLAE